MNKNDVKLIIITLIVASIFLVIFKLTETKKDLKALVYYENKVVLTIDLNKEEQEYNVKGYNGNIKILAGNGRVKVDEEKSPLHLCSKQGYISKSYESIICLPNKIVIKIEQDKSDIDTVVR